MTRVNMVNASAAKKMKYALNQSVTMNAGTSMSQNQTSRRRRVWRGMPLIVALLATGPAGASGQTGQVAPSPKFVAYDNNGDPCNGCLLFAYVAGTTTKQDTYTSSTLGTANANPVVLDAAGRATVFLDPTKSYKFTLAPSTDSDPPAAPIWSVDSVVGPFSSVVPVTAANARGLQISRSSADAGLSVESSGGSGKTYGIVSTTTGELQIRDDADGTPSLAFVGNNITAALTGTFTVSGGLLASTGFGTHSVSAGGTGAQYWSVRNTSAGTGNIAGVLVGNNSASDLTGLYSFSSTFTTSGVNVASGTLLEAKGAGGLNIAAADSTGVIRIYSGGANERVRVTSTGRVGLGTSAPSNDVDVRSTSDGIGSGGLRISRSDDSYLILNMDDGGASTAWGSIQAGDSSTNRPLKLQPSGSVVLMPTQPAFLAYNSALDGLATGATLDFDTEVFDVAGNFASDTFTAPVDGVYHFCAAVEFSDNAASSVAFSFSISGALYQFMSDQAITSGSASGCIDVQMTAAQTATVVVTTGDVALDVEGSASPRITWFSGRLVQ